MINIERRSRIDIITFKIDKINATITDDLKNEIYKVLDNASPMVILDLKGVQYIDSTGFGCFLYLHKSARHHFGLLKFARPEPSVLRIFDTLNLNTVFEIYENLDDCIGSFSK